MQKNLFKDINLWIKQNKVIDVIVFGSYSRGKENIRDIDLCILVEDKDEKKSIDLVDSLSKLDEKLHVNIITLSSFIKGNTLSKTLLKEGFSIKENRSFSFNFGFENKSLFLYNLKNFSPSKRVKFHYLLKGRYGAKGILKEAKGNFLGKGAILVNYSKEELLKEVFDNWSVNYVVKKVLFS